MEVLWAILLFIHTFSFTSSVLDLNNFHVSFLETFVSPLLYCQEVFSILRRIKVEIST